MCDRRTAPRIEALVAEHGLTSHATRAAPQRARLRRAADLRARARGERTLPADLVTALEERLAAHGLAEDEITIRMTGCPNGCARPYIAEIGLVGKGPGRYNLYLGAAFDGSRLSKLYAEDLEHDGIVAALDPLFAAYATERRTAERFGAFLIRTKRIAKTAQRRATSTPIPALDCGTAPELAG